MTDQTIYDRVRYPSLVFSQTHPERLAVLARLAGLDPVPPGEARVLEIGGGDCMNTVAFAAAYPGAQVCGFDLSQAAIADGQALVAGAGLGNVELVVEDILEAAGRYPARSFDYVIVHGVYAWVPDAVREACMALIGHVLSDRGVAFVSYNVSAGGHVRRFLREMLGEVLRGIDEPAARIAEARRYVSQFVIARDDDTVLMTALREQAKKLIEKKPEVLFHDELGEIYEPQSLRQVCEAAARHGLRHLSDSGRHRAFDGFLTEGEDQIGDGDEQVLRAAQLDDFETARFFRQTLLVRAGAAIDRRIDLDRIAGLLVSTRLRRDEAGDLHEGGSRISLNDEGLAVRLAALGAQYPRRVALSDLAENEAQRQAIVQLFADWFVYLHTDPLPFSLAPGEHPCTSALVRQQLAQGDEVVTTLDHALLSIGQPALRRLLSAADGTRTQTELAALDHGIPAAEVVPALTAAAELGLLSA